MHSDKQYSVILDTSFLIRLLSGVDPLHDNAKGYFRYFLENNIPMYVSTITIAEYCVNGEVSELPLKNLRVLPFNINHAPIAGKYAKALYDARQAKEIVVDQRLIIPNDAKIFAQAHDSSDVSYFVTSDSKAELLIKKISEKEDVSFAHMDIHTPYNQQFGIIDF